MGHLTQSILGYKWRLSILQRQKMKKALIIANRQYASLDFLIEGLKESSVPHEEIDFAGYPENLKNSFFFDSKNRLTIIEENVLNLQEIGSAIYQGHNQPVISQ